MTLVKNNFVEKIVLGTAQFGTDYGIANMSGKPETKKAYEILEFAWDAGIKRFDTAPSYGSEALLGDFARTNGIQDKIKFITKIPPIKKNFHYDLFIKEEVENSLKNLGAPIDVLFFHNSKDAILLEEDPKFFKKLQKNNPIFSYGASIYETEDIDRHSNYNFQFCLQYPYNILDQRFSKINVPFSKKYARSIFLQGVLASNAKLKNSAPSGLKKMHKEYHEILSKNDIDPISFAAQFVFQNNEIDFFILGVEKKSQLEHLINIEAVFDSHVKLLDPIFKKINTGMIDPRKWS